MRSAGMGTIMVGMGVEGMAVGGTGMEAMMGEGMVVTMEGDMEGMMGVGMVVTMEEGTMGAMEVGTLEAMEVGILGVVMEVEGGIERSS